jgi:hypothetical protein
VRCSLQKSPLNFPPTLNYGLHCWMTLNELLSLSKEACQVFSRNFLIFLPHIFSQSLICLFSLAILNPHNSNVGRSSIIW